MRVIPLCLLIISNISSYAASSSFDIIRDESLLKISTPALHDRKSVKLKLANGLEVYIISDPDSTHSAAALCVEAGSWHEPENYPGLAHFCEHMLFMGSEKYPDENLFSKLIADNGGMTNAYTSCIRTNYMFSSSHRSFNELLDIFAQFFISPLFKADSVKRELLAVHQEYENATQNDNFREWMIFKKTSKQNHPFSRFDIGTESTLSVVPLDVLKQWHQKYYSANKMHLSIYTNQNLETMSSQVAEIFSPITSTTPPSLPYTPFISDEQKGHITYIKPLKDIRKITFTWEMPETAARDLNAKIPHLIAYTLSYKGDNTLFAKLKERHLAEDLGAYCETLGDGYMFLNLSINLTKEGLSQLDEVILTTFSIINQLKREGIPVHVFDECRKMSLLEYEWQSRPDEFRFVSSTADQMTNEPLSTFPHKTISPFSYKPMEAKDILKQLTPESTVFMVIANPELSGQMPDQKEPWLGGEYNVVKLDEEKLRLFSRASPPTKTFLSPNQFVPKSLSLLSSVKGKENFEPLLLGDEALGKCYFMQDLHYLVPKGYIDVGIKTPLFDGDAKSIVLTDVLILDLDHKLAPLLSAAERGGLDANLYQKDYQLHIVTFGYHEKCHLLLEGIFEEMKNSYLSKESFEQYKDRLLKAYANKERSLSVAQGKDMLLSLLFNTSPLPKDLLVALEQITYDDYILFRQNLLQQAYFETMIYGNLDLPSAQKIWSHVKNAFPVAAYPIDRHSKKKILKLEEAKKPMKVTLQSPLPGDATLLCLGFGASNYSKLATQKILSQVISEAFFDTLRTKQQTGYIAQSVPIESDGLIMQLFAVNSTTHYSSELLARFELFLEQFNRSLSENIPEERFTSIANTLVDTLEKPPSSPYLKARELTNLAFTENGNFLKKQKLIEAIKNLSYSDFLQITSGLLDRKNPQRIAILVSGSTEKPFFYTKSTPEAIKSLQF